MESLQEEKQGFGHSRNKKSEALRLEIYVWPMITEYRHGTQKLLVRAPLIGSVQ